MSDTSRRDEIHELASLRAVDGLSEMESMRLRRLSEEFDERDAESIELAAAALDLSFLDELEESLPADLERRVLEQARARRGREPDRRDAGGNGLSILPWMLAAAACVLAVFAWWPRGDEPAALSPALRMARLESEASDLLRASWTALDQPGYEGVRGEVVFSPDRQEGYMKLSGLPRNKDLGKQYQLWIVDKDRDGNHPVDGGVFDFDPADPGGEVVVPISAKLNCPSPDLFALTLERPGGVVVSAGPLLVAATPD